MKEEKIKVYAKDKGSLYIKASELFALAKVQAVIKKVCESKIGKHQ